MLRNYGQRDRYNAIVSRGINSRLDEVQARVLSIRLKKLEGWNRRKAALMTRYREELASLPLRFQEVTRGCDPAWHLGVVRLESGARHDALVKHLETDGIHTMIHYPIPTHLQQAFRFDTVPSLPETEALAQSIVSLPMNMVLTDDEQELVIASIRKFF
jgi:dTDP-4-amino-4,6-dideoxygalactose transaminase